MWTNKKQNNFNIYNVVFLKKNKERKTPVARYHHHHNLNDI